MDADVIVIGAGPTGLCAAAELRRAGAEVLLLEQNGRATPGSRAIGIHGPALAALEPSGATEILLAAGTRVRQGVARGEDRELGRVSFDRAPLRYPYALALPQAVTEDALRKLAPEAQFGSRVVDIRDRGDTVEVDTVGVDTVEVNTVEASTVEASTVEAHTAGERTLRAHFAVVATGAAGRALIPQLSPRIRRYTDSYLMADLDSTPHEPAETAVITLSRHGVVESFPLPEGGRRLVAWVGAGRASQRSGEQLRAAIAERVSAELAERVETAHGFGIRRTLLPRMRTGRILVVGDAAHEVSPIGGQGMNLGLLDAVGLAPALLEVLRTGDDRLLRRWESRRLVSARRAATLADVNTRLGRPRSARANEMLGRLVATLLATRASGFAARAFSMGFDRDAR